MNIVKDAPAATVRETWRALELGVSIAERTRGLRDYQFQVWEQYAKNPPLENVTSGFVEQFQGTASAAGLAADTINRIVDTVYQVLRGAAESDLIRKAPKRPKKLIPASIRRKPTLEQFDKFLSCLPEAIRGTRGRSLGWWLAFWGTIYLTAMRLRDLERLRREQVGEQEIEFRQSKTSGLVRLPVHPVLFRLLAGLRNSDGQIFRIGRKTLYRVTKRCCELANVNSISPQMIRVLSSRQHERAHAGAGRIILGRGFLGCDAAYLEPHEILQEASQRVMLPQSLLTAEERSQKMTGESVLTVAFGQLGQQDRETVLRVALSLRR